MKTEKAKIAVYGGSFDPLHYGHIDIVKNLERVFDDVIVMPSYISPFKTNCQNAAARYKQCKKVFLSQKTRVSKYEISRQGISYSVDTAAYLARRTKADIYWVIGSEELVRLTEWHDIDRLKTLVVFFVVQRPWYSVKPEQIKALKKHGIKIKIAKFIGLDVSSTLVKIDAAFGKPNKYMPSELYAAAVASGTFDKYARYVAGLYRHNLSANRVEHTYLTAVRGAELAKMYGVCVDDTVTACILHDIAKHEDSRNYADVVNIAGYPEPTVHAPIGGYIAKTEFGVSQEIADAITKHSTADANMTALEETVYLADKTEVGRRYPSLEHKRYLCTVDRHIAMLAALKEIAELDESDSCEYEKNAIRYYEQLCGDVKIPELPQIDKTALLPIVEPRSALESGASDKVGVAQARDNKRDYPMATRRITQKDILDIAEIKKIAYAAAAELSSHKARDIDIIDLAGKTIIADYFVIASVTSTTAVKALMGYVEDRLTKQFGLDPNKRDIDGEWIALDYGGIIIHIFTEKTRAFYNIERLWADGSNIDRYKD